MSHDLYQSKAFTCNSFGAITLNAQPNGELVMSLCLLLFLLARGAVR